MVKVWRWIVGAGVVVVVVGLVALIWMQIVIPDTPFGSSAFSRWQEAMAPLFVTALGLLLVTAALILRSVEPRQPN